MVAAFEDLEIGAASERGFDVEAHGAGRKCGWSERFNADIFFAMQNGGFHWRIVEGEPAGRARVLNWLKLRLSSGQHFA